MSEGYSLIGNAINDYVGSGDTLGGLSNIGSSTSSAGGFNFGSLPWSTIIGTLGKLGSGIGTGVASYQAGNEADYIPYTRWLGNGLAMTGYLNNSQNKQNRLDQAFGAGNMLSSLFSNGFSLFGNGTSNNSLDELPTQYNIYDTNWYDDIYKSNTPVGSAINNNMRS